MSTKTSSDLHVTRPSTRLHAPPGGSTSINFGEDLKPVVTNSVSPSQASVEATSAGVVREPVTEQLPFNVIIVVAANAAEDIVVTVTKALKTEGIVNVSVVRTEAALDVTYASQALCGSCDGIVACAVVTGDVATNGSLSQSITAALLQVGVMGKTPIIPCIIGANSLLEAKVLFGDKAPSLAKSLVSTLQIKSNPQSMAMAPPPQVGDVYNPIDVSKQTSVEGLVAALRESFKKHGANGIFGIARKFRIIDDDNSNSVGLSEFKKAIAEHAMDWSDQQIKMVFDHFDRDKNGTISYDEFLRGVRDPLNDRRTQLILLAFQVDYPSQPINIAFTSEQILDTDKSGAIEVNDLLGKYDCSKHPGVISGRLTENQVLR